MADRASKHARKSGLRPDEVRLWHETMADVRPLRGEKPWEDALPEDDPGPVEEAVVDSGPPPEAEAPPPPPRKPSQPKPGRKPLTPGDTSSMDRRTADRFRRGRLPIEARLDLHGLTQAEAHRALDSFVDAGYRAGRRCVLVITGKGTRGESGVLRRAVPQWLNEPSLRGRVLAFTHARPHHGGEGALYLLLRRRRED